MTPAVAETRSIRLRLTEDDAYGIMDALSYYVLARAGDECDEGEKAAVAAARRMESRLADALAAAAIDRLRTDYR